MLRKFCEGEASVSGMLHEEFKKFSADTDVERKLVSFGLKSVWITGRRAVPADRKRHRQWRDFIAAANIKAEQK
jgi:hypothetical protein